jgi:hypothetical protein
MSSRPNEPIPQGLKPSVLQAHCGTAEAVPFQNTIYATSSRGNKRDAQSMGLLQAMQARPAL